MTTYGYTTKDVPIDDAMIDKIAAEAEAGFPGWTLERPSGGRPPLDGTSAAGTRTVRIPADLDQALAMRAEAENTTPSSVIREALRRYLAA